MVLYRQNRGFIDHIRKIRADRPARGQGNIFQIDGLVHVDILGMHLQDVDTALQVRFLNDDAAVETSGTQQRRVQDLRPVRGCQDQQSFGCVKTVHLREQLVQCLLTLIIAAVAARVPALADRVDLIDKNDAGRVLLRLIKQVPDPGGADADEHLHKIGTGQ